jgi:hypothetical protein
MKGFAMKANNNSELKYIPVTHWNDYHSWPPQGGLRHLIFNAESNGFNKVIKRAGRRVLINEQAFFQWLEDQNEGGA